MNLATCVLYLVVLMSASSLPNNRSCPSIEPRYLDIPMDGKTRNDSVCTNLYSWCPEETLDIESQDGQIFNLRKVVVEPHEPCETAMMHFACYLSCFPVFSRMTDNSSCSTEICRGSCESLFSACKSEMTCTDEWTIAFDGSDFNCTENNDTDNPLKDVWSTFNGSAETFCSKLSDDGVVSVATNDEDCMDIMNGVNHVETKSYHLSMYDFFSYLGMAVVIVVICLAITKVTMYVVAKYLLIQSIESPAS